MKRFTDGESCRPNWKTLPLLTFHCRIMTHLLQIPFYMYSCTSHRNSHILHWHDNHECLIYTRPHPGIWHMTMKHWNKRGEKVFISTLCSPKRSKTPAHQRDYIKWKNSGKSNLCNMMKTCFLRGKGIGIGNLNVCMNSFQTWLKIPILLYLVNKFL